MAVREAILAITGRCNARCSMCAIWRDTPGQEVEPSYYFHLPPTLTQVNLTGGEPFLRKDLAEILLVITHRCRKVRPVISTNGLLTERIIRTVPALLDINPRTALRVSIDGIDSVHDTIRGVEGAFEKAMTTLRELKKAGVTDLGIGFTLVASNATHMMDVAELARQEGVQFTSTVAHSSPIFFGDQSEQEADPDQAAEAFGALLNRQLASRHPKDWYRAYFTAGLIEMLAGHPRKIICPALQGFFFLDPQGMVYPCHILDQPVGRLDQAPYARLIDQAPGGAGAYANCSKQCWMTCTVAPQMRRRLGTVTAWVLGAKIKGRLRGATSS